MKPAWDKLGSTYDGHAVVQVIDVDCTAEPGGQELCGEYGVQGFPTVKYFDGSDPSGSDYEGGRDFSSLNDFVQQSLLTKCDPITKEGCSDIVVETLKQFEGLSAAELEAKTAEMAKQMKAAKEHFETVLKGLQETYEKEKKIADDLEAELKPQVGALKMLLRAGASKDEL